MEGDDIDGGLYMNDSYDSNRDDGNNANTDAIALPEIR